MLSNYFIDMMDDMLLVKANKTKNVTRAPDTLDNFSRLSS